MEPYHSDDHSWEHPRRRLFSGADDDPLSDYPDDYTWNGTSSSGGSSHTSAYDTDRIEIRNGYPIRYKCMDYAATMTLPGRNNSNNDSSASAVVVANVMEVSFNYEVVLASSQKTDFTTSILELEWSILWNMVEDLGLNRCDFQKQTQAFGHLTSFLIQQHQDGDDAHSNNLKIFNTTSSYVLSLSSDDRDSVDMEAESCHQTGSIATPHICVPMKGSMQVLYTGDQPELLEQLIRDEIQMVMTSPSMMVGDILAVTFVESKEATNPTNAADSNNSASSFGMTAAITAGILAMAVIGIFMAMALLRRKRRRVVHKGRGADYEAESEQIPDLEQVRTTSSDSSERKTKSPRQTEHGAEEPWEPLQPPMDVEYNGVVVPVLPTAAVLSSSSSIYLASTRPRTRKRVAKKKKSLRERVSLPPSGMESIPEGDGDFQSALYDMESPGSEGSSEEEEDDDDDNDDGQPVLGVVQESPPRANLPNASPPTSPLIFQAESSSPDSAKSNEKKKTFRPILPPWV